MRPGPGGLTPRTTITPSTLATEFDGMTPSSLRARPGKKWRCPPGDVLPAWVADMDFPVAAPILQRLKRVAQGGAFGYPDWSNGTPVREAFAARMAERYGWCPDPGQVREFTTVTQAVHIALHLATEPGDGVAVHTPAFGPLLDGITQANRHPVPIPMLDTPGGWTFDAERFAEDVATTGCRVLLLVNPHNPTGRVFTRDELRTLADIAERYDLLVIADEVHADLTYAPHEHVPFASLDPALESRTVTLTSASKAFNLAAARCAVGHVGPAHLRETLARQPVELFGAPNLFGVQATVAAWTEADDWLTAILDYLDSNRRLIADVLATRLPHIDHHAPEATYLAWLDCRALGWGDDPATRFRDRGRIELSSGPEFNPGGDGFARLNFATSRTVLSKVLDRLVHSTTGGSLIEEKQQC